MGSVRSKCIVALILLFKFTCASAADLNLPPTERPQMRPQIRTCATFLVTGDQQDDSVGVPFAAKSAADFRDELQVAIANFGIEKFRNGVFYRLGVPMKDERSIRIQYAKVLEDLGLNAVGARIKVLAVPSNLIQENSVSIARDAWERFRAFGFSWNRDGQAPHLAEVGGDWAVNTFTEIFNVIFLFSQMSNVDAALTVATHATVLASYMIFSKSMLNWLFNSNFKSKRLAWIELWMKQMSLSLPFIINYQIFGQFTQIHDYVLTHPVAESAMGLVSGTGEYLFNPTNLLTMFDQTLFYSTVITSGFGNWVNTQIGDQNTKAARILRPWLQSPLLIMDAIFLAMASKFSPDLAALGPLHVNAGHAGIAGLTLFGNWLFQSVKRFDKATKQYVIEPRAKKWLDTSLPLWFAFEKRFATKNKPPSPLENITVSPD